MTTIAELATDVALQWGHDAGVVEDCDRVAGRDRVSMPQLQWGHDAGVVEDGPPSRPLRVNNLCIAPREVTDRIGSAYSRQIGRATEVFDHQPVLTRERGSCINLNLTTGLSKNFRSNSGETTIPPPRRSRRFRE